MGASCPFKYVVASSNSVSIENSFEYAWLKIKRKESKIVEQVVYNKFYFRVATLVDYLVNA